LARGVGLAVRSAVIEACGGVEAAARPGSAILLTQFSPLTKEEPFAVAATVKIDPHTGLPSGLGAPGAIGLGRAGQGDEGKE
jgi:hypothetical protein